MATVPPPPATVLIDGMRDIAARYRLVVVDQWGVLHDGFHLHPGAAAALAALRAAGVTVALLSNSARRAADSRTHLAELGIGPAHYDLSLTSGEQVYQDFMRIKPGTMPQLPGPRYRGFFRDSYRGLVAGTPLQEVADMAGADFILFAGTDGRGMPAYKAELQRAAARNLPMLVANPDRVSRLPDGRFVLCPGVLADYYAKIGGPVYRYGKPQAAAYAQVRALTGEEGPALGIGDSLDHDIRGARDAGMDSLLICHGGIHGRELSRPPRARELAMLVARHGVLPTYALDRFVW